MTRGFSVLCPVDFSEYSRSALRYGAAVAEHFGASLIVVTVSDPLLSEVAEMRMGAADLAQNIERELRQFVGQAFEHGPKPPRDPLFVTAVGKPAPEILRVAREHGSDLIVMSSHGLTGLRKFFFGATTERVLRETTIPVLVTPGEHVAPKDLTELKGTGRPVLVPVDLSDAGLRQVKIAGAIADALRVPVLLSHVIEPLRYPVPVPMSLPNVDAERRAKGETALRQLAASIPSGVKHEALIAYGDPAEEVAKIARDRHASLIVMGLQASSITGPRMGSVTYRVLCLAASMVLAIPPAPAKVQGQSEGHTEHVAPVNRGTWL
jgi:nucleotide-binding universal stress UspA family protein